MHIRYIYRYWYIFICIIFIKSLKVKALIIILNLTTKISDLGLIEDLTYIL